MSWPVDEPPNCSNHLCLRPAEAEDDDGRPYCLDCADELLERWVAIELTPALRETLPPLWES